VVNKPPAGSESGPGKRGNKAKREGGGEKKQTISGLPTGEEKGEIKKTNFR